MNELVKFLTTKIGYKNKFTAVINIRSTSLIVDKFLWIKNKINKGKVIKTEQTSNSTEQT